MKKGIFAHLSLSAKTKIAFFDLKEWQKFAVGCFKKFTETHKNII